MKRCTRCIMPESVPGISFDSAGVCSYCLEYRNEESLGENAFQEIIAFSRKTKSTYDCVVPLSGGRDSSFVLYLAKVKYNLKPLAVSNDNEFRVEQALVNMQTACRKLKVDFLNVRSKRDIAHKIVKSNFRASTGFGQFGLCNACVYGYRSAVYIAAEKYGIPLILWGESKQEATQDMEKKAFSALNGTGHSLGKLLNINFYLSEYYKLLQRMESPVYGNSVFSRSIPVLKNKEIKEVRVFDYLTWDREQMKAAIINDLGWRKPEDHVSTWRTDCRLHPLVNYTFYKLFGCSKDCFGYHKMINSGQMKRDEALIQEEVLLATYDDKHVRKLLTEMIGLSSQEATAIIGFKMVRQVCPGGNV